MSFTFIEHDINLPFVENQARVPYNPPVNPHRFGQYAMNLLIFSFIFLSFFIM